MLGAGLAASVASAASVHAAPRIRALTLASLLLPLLAAIGGTSLSIRELLAAVSAHSAEDCGITVLLGIGEIASLELMAAVIGSVGCVMLAASAMLTSRRISELATAATALPLAAGLTARAELVVEFQRALKTIIHTSPAPFSTRLLAHAVDGEVARLLANACFVAAVALAGRVLSTRSG